MSPSSGEMPLTRAGPLRWRSGTGWLVLAGGSSSQGKERQGAEGSATRIERAHEEVDGAALGWADLDRPMALVPTAGGSSVEAEALLESYVDLGAPTGYIVPIFDAAGAQLIENCQLLEEAGLIYIQDGPDPVGLVRSFRASPGLDAVARAFEQGAAVMGVGAGAEAVGAWVAAPSPNTDAPPRPEPGWGWLNDVIVASHFRGTEATPQLRHLLNLRPNCLGLGIPDGVALGLGPLGEVENVGAGQVTVVVSGLEVEV